MHGTEWGDGRWLVDCVVEDRARQTSPAYLLIELVEVLKARTHQNRVPLRLLKPEAALPSVFLPAGRFSSSSGKPVDRQFAFPPCAPPLREAGRSLAMLGAPPSGLLHAAGVLLIASTAAASSVDQRAAPPPPPSAASTSALGRGPQRPVRACAPHADRRRRR